jgi:hypothetical protein
MTDDITNWSTDDFDDDPDADGAVTVAHDGCTIHGSDTVDEAAMALFDAFGGDYCMTLVLALLKENSARKPVAVRRDVRSGRSRFVS